MTHPTVGPLFGSYKVQCDVFSIPMRLYLPVLHNNPINIGLQMKNVKLPQIAINAPNLCEKYGHWDTQQVNPSSLIAYLGMRSFGHDNEHDEAYSFYKKWNAIPYIAYFDIFKNFYANKQLDEAFIIHSSKENNMGFITAYSYRAVNISSKNLDNGSQTVDSNSFTFVSTHRYSSLLQNQYLRLHGKNLYNKYLQILCNVKKGVTTTLYEGTLNEFFDITYEDENFIEYRLKYEPEYVGVDNSFTLDNITISTRTNLDKLGIDLVPFELKDIDTMREKYYNILGIILLLLVILFRDLMKIVLRLILIVCHLKNILKVNLWKICLSY